MFDDECTPPLVVLGVGGWLTSWGWWGLRDDLLMMWIAPAPDRVGGPLTGDDRPILEGVLRWHARHSSIAVLG